MFIYGKLGDSKIQWHVQLGAVPLHKGFTGVKAHHALVKGEWDHRDVTPNVIPYKHLHR